MYSMLYIYYYAGYIRFIIDHRHIEWTADGSGGETRVEWEADNGMNVPSLFTKAWLIIVTLQSNQQSILYVDVIGCVQQTQLLRSGSVSARCYWCILLDHPIAASAHGSAAQQLSLLNHWFICYAYAFVQIRWDDLASVGLLLD